jgi:predicted RNA-binding Zn-ribbon protein involved in translation (DUF1610 family)
VPLGFL